jgi:hypothetical protein
VVAAIQGLLVSGPLIGRDHRVHPVEFGPRADKIGQGPDPGEFWLRMAAREQPRYASPGIV